MIRHILVLIASLIQPPFPCGSNQEKLRYLYTAKSRKSIPALTGRYFKLRKRLFPFFLSCVFLPKFPLCFCQFLRMRQPDFVRFIREGFQKNGFPLSARHASVFFQGKCGLKRPIPVIPPEKVSCHCPACRMLFHFLPVRAAPQVAADKGTQKHRLLSFYEFFIGNITWLLLYEKQSAGTQLFLQFHLLIIRIGKLLTDDLTLLLQFFCFMLCMQECLIVKPAEQVKKFHPYSLPLRLIRRMMMNNHLSQHFFVEKADCRFPLHSDSGPDCIRRQVVHAVCGHSQQISAHGIHRLPSNAVEKFRAAFMGHLQEPFPHIRKSQKGLIFPVRIDITVIFFRPESPDSGA